MPGNPATTIFCGNLDDRVNERILYDIMVQAGPLADVHMPRDRETQKHKGYGFAEFETEQGAHYALKLFSGLVTLFNRQVRFSMAGASKASSLSPAGDRNGDQAIALEDSQMAQPSHLLYQQQAYQSPREGHAGLPMGLYSPASTASPVTPSRYNGWGYASGAQVMSRVHAPWLSAPGLLGHGPSLLHRQ